MRVYVPATERCLFFIGLYNLYRNAEKYSDKTTKLEKSKKREKNEKNPCNEGRFIVL